MRRAVDLDANRVVVSNDLGSFAVLPREEYAALEEGRAVLPLHRVLDLEAKGLLEAKGTFTDLERAILRTRKAFLLDGPALHIFVVTLRCDHSCHYCQVSRANADAVGFDLREEDARAAVDRVFESPSPSLTIEFQGGEPSIRFDLVRKIVAWAEAANETASRDLRFSMVSTLHHLGQPELEFCRDHNIHISTSIDGPRETHEAHRPNPTRDSWQRTIDGLHRARLVLGIDGVSALPTVTRRALEDPITLVDHYRHLGFRSIFLRPVAPYGFARKTKRTLGYSMAEFLQFYEAALEYILRLNERGEEFEETSAAIMLRHILTPYHSGYVDLRSPAGAGLGALVYNYDGLVYPSDEARMAAATGDKRFALGSVYDSLDDLMSSDPMAWLRTGAVAEELSDCSSCGFVPFCGADPVHHAIVQGDPRGDRATSDFCAKHIGIFRMLFRRLTDGDVDTRRTLTAWGLRRSRAEIETVGHVEV